MRGFVTIPHECTLYSIYKTFIVRFSESVAYEFGPNRGIITYTYPEDRRPEVQDDFIALGFITAKSDAVLLRIMSGTSNDYIELEIVSTINSTYIRLKSSSQSYSDYLKTF